jgi:hypothetical protein
MIPSRIWVGIAVLALVACKDREPQPPEFSDVFPLLPLPPNVTDVSHSSGTDALLIKLTSSAKARDVETYYRSVLTQNGWRLVNDMRERDGSVVLLAEQDGPPLWVRIKSTDDSIATIVELAGAVVADSSKRVKPAS